MSLETIQSMSQEITTPAQGEVIVLTDPNTVLSDIVAIVIGATVDINKEA